MDRIIHKEILSKDECNKLIDIHKKWKSLKIVLETGPGDVTDKTEYNIYMGIVNKILPIIIKDSNIDSVLENTTIMEYNYKEHCPLHRDNLTSDSKPNHTPNRVWSASVMLNNNYTNGYFKFHRPDEQYKLNTGDMVSFNANQYHSTNPPGYKTTRYVLLLWLGLNDIQSN